MNNKTRNFIKLLTLGRIKKETVPNPDIVAIGDSNTEISYFGSIPEKRWTYIIGKNLSADVYNFGIGGRSTFDFLPVGGEVGKSRLDKIINFDAKYYIICFGLNDEKYIDTVQFEEYQRELVNQIQTNTNGTPILMTNVWVDYPDHYSYDRNTLKIEPYDNVKRKIAKELGIHLIDVYQRFKYEYEVNGIWDTRIRNTEVWDDSLDDIYGDDVSWFSNIHYNILGNEIVADEITNYFINNNLSV